MTRPTNWHPKSRTVGRVLRNLDVLPQWHQCDVGHAKFAQRGSFAPGEPGHLAEGLGATFEF